MRLYSVLSSSFPVVCPLARPADGSDGDEEGGVERGFLNTVGAAASTTKGLDLAAAWPST